MRQRSLGFTLIELLITITVAVVLLAVGVPGFQGLFNKEQVVTLTNDFLTALNNTRSEAAKGGATTTICMSNNNATCTGNSGWPNGWIIWVDRNGNGAMDAGELVRTHGVISSGKTTMGGGAKTSFSFNGQGALTTAAGADTINVCTPSNLSLSNQISVEASGHVGRKSNSSLATCP